MMKATRKTAVKRSKPHSYPKIEIEKWEKEGNDFYAQLGRCISVWAVVEMSLLNIYRACLPGSDIVVMAAAFHAVENARSRVGMIDAALSVALKGNPLLAQWSQKGGLFSRVTASARTRNHFAHYMVLHLSAVKKPPSVYLLPPLSKPMNDAFDSRRPSGGYYISDLKNIHKQFGQLCDDLRIFSSQIGEPIKQHAKSSAQTRRRLLARALKGLESS